MRLLIAVVVCFSSIPFGFAQDDKLEAENNHYDRHNVPDRVTDGVNEVDKNMRHTSMP